MAIEHITTAQQAAALGARLNGSDRSKPIALVSTPAGRDAPWVDVDRLASEFGDLVEVVVITTGKPTMTLAGTLPPKTEAYGGAGRVYPVGHEWTTDLRRSPLRFAYDPGTGDVSTRLLVRDGLAMANAAGLFNGARHRTTVEAGGVVKQLPTPERALVELDDRVVAKVDQELTVPEVPLERTLVPGQRVVGLHDPDARRLDLRPSLRKPDDALAAYSVGDVVLAVTHEVHERRATLTLYPGVDVVVDRDQVTSNDLDDLRSLMTEGEVVAARVVAREPWILSMLDVDDRETPVPAVALLPEGPPWLVPPVVETVWTVVAPVAETITEAAPEIVHLPPDTPPDGPPAPEPATTHPPSPPRPTPRLLDPKHRGDAAPSPPAAPAPREPAQVPQKKIVRDLSLKVDERNAEVAKLKTALHGLGTERDLLASQLTAAHTQGNQLRSEIKRLRTELRRRSRGSSARQRADLFTDPEEQFRYDVTHAWALRIPAADKPARPLTSYSIGPGFLESLERLEGVTRDKVVDVVVEILTGLAAEQPGRGLHQLRGSEAGGSGQVAREDGAKAWRANLQTNTPSARRIHYWVLPGGGIELARVGLHDDFAV